MSVLTYGALSWVLCHGQLDQWIVFVLNPCLSRHTFMDTLWNRPSSIICLIHTCILYDTRFSWIVSWYKMSVCFRTVRLYINGTCERRLKPPLLCSPLYRQYKYSFHSVPIRCMRCAGLSQPSSLMLSCLESQLFPLLSFPIHCPSLLPPQCRPEAW